MPEHFEQAPQTEAAPEKRTTPLPAPTPKTSSPQASSNSPEGAPRDEDEVTRLLGSGLTPAELKEFRKRRQEYIDGDDH